MPFPINSGPPGGYRSRSPGGPLRPQRLILASPSAPSPQGPLSFHPSVAWHVPGALAYRLYIPMPDGGVLSRELRGKDVHLTCWDENGRERWSHVVDKKEDASLGIMGSGGYRRVAIPHDNSMHVQMTVEGNILLSVESEFLGSGERTLSPLSGGLLQAGKSEGFSPAQKSLLVQEITPAGNLKQRFTVQGEVFGRKPTIVNLGALRYFVRVEQDLLALTREGNVLWRAPLGTSCSRPTVDPLGDLHVIAAKGQILRIRPATGEIVPGATIEDFSQLWGGGITPLPDRSGYLVHHGTGSGAHFVISVFDWNDRQRVRFSATGFSHPLIHGGALYYTNTFRPPRRSIDQDSDTFLCKRPLADLQGKAQEVFMKGPVSSNIAAFGGRIVIANNYDDLLYAFDTDLKPLGRPYRPTWWRYAGPNEEMWHESSSHPRFLPDGRLLYQCNNGKIYCLRMDR